MSDQPGQRKPNHLEGQTSPYLLQHLYNPVDWHPWGPEALEKARREDKPLFVSIGYAACHWCHVMERESFEDPKIAAILNEHFVSIKIDREERPDIDEIYMAAVQVMSGHGGWPLNVFLTPELEPFVGGTYFPPESRYGLLSFRSVLARIREVWTTRRDEVHDAATGLTERLRGIAAGLVGPADGDSVDRALVQRGVDELTGRFDDVWGGFGGAPKFPPDTSLTLILREHARSGQSLQRAVVERTLDAMALGGMYDHVGGGFARYSVDERWLVPHFEKMLYNQALLVPNYVDAWLLFGKPLYRRVVEQTLDFVRRELTDPEGGFYSSLDADSEGVEGKFYVFTPAEIREVLGAEDGQRFCAAYGIDEAGNFEGRSIPNLLHGSLEEQAARQDTTEDRLDASLAPLRARVLEARERRVRPGTDDKVLTAWNGLMITAFCRGFQAFGRDADLEAATRAAAYVETHLTRGDRLLVSRRAGTSQLNAYLDDYAFFARGLLDLYESSFERRHLDLAATLAASALAHFEDAEVGGFYFTSDDHETLLTRNRSQHDGALPAGAGVLVELLLRLGVHLDRSDSREAAERALAAYRPAVERAPSAYGSLLLGADLAGAGLVEVAVIGPPGDDDTTALLRTLRGRYLPRRALAFAAPDALPEDLPLLAGKPAPPSGARAYVCRKYACEEPTSDPDRLAELLG
jgi:uncharacterized protein YyaL (SSP411 family)